MFDRLPIKDSNPFDAFKRDERGSILILSLFLFVVMLMVSGLAIDFMRAETERVRLQSTLDRAILSASSMEQTLDSETVVRDYFEREGLTDYLDDVNVSQGQFYKEVNATASASVTPFFLKMLGINKMPANTYGAAREGYTDIEISLVLDVSGSMGWVSTATGNVKIEDLKDAAQEFVYRVQCDPDAGDPELFTLSPADCVIDPETVSVNLVMYNENVLVGETLLSMFNVTNEHSYSSCVDFEDADYTTSAITDTQLLQRAGHFDAWSVWYQWWNGSNVAKDYARSCRVDISNEIVPLEENWQTLYNDIEDLDADGYTSIEMGVKWGAALLDPAFNDITTQLVALNTSSGGAEGVVPAFADRPYDGTLGGVKKVLVVMTDGENTYNYTLKDAYRSGPSEYWYDDDANGDGNKNDPVISIYRSSNNKYRNPLTGAEKYTPYGDNPWQLDWVEVWQMFGTDFYDNSQNNSAGPNWTGNPVNQTSPSTKNANMIEICTAAKAQNMIIYTVGFETTTASTTVLKQCASSDAHHFDADGDNIDDAFASIARSIQKLRLIN